MHLVRYIERAQQEFRFYNVSYFYSPLTRKRKNIDALIVSEKGVLVKTNWMGNYLFGTMLIQLNTKFVVLSLLDKNLPHVIVTRVKVPVPSSKHLDIF